MASLHVDGALIAPLIIVLLFATSEDLLAHRIPNVLVGIGLGVGILVHTSVRGWDGAIFSLLGAFVGLAALLPFYLLRGMGAGDVKLMATVGSFLGPLGALHAAAVTLALGAVLGAGIIVGRGLARARARTERLAEELHDSGAAPVSVRKERFPYAVAIAGGTVLLMWHQGQLAHLAAFLVG